LGGGVDQWGADRPGMKKVLLGESEVFFSSDRYMIESKFGQNMDDL